MIQGKGRWLNVGHVKRKLEKHTQAKEKHNAELKSTLQKVYIKRTETWIVKQKTNYKCSLRIKERIEINHKVRNDKYGRM